VISYLGTNILQNPIPRGRIHETQPYLHRHLLAEPELGFWVRRVL